MNKLIKATRIKVSHTCDIVKTYGPPQKDMVNYWLNKGWTIITIVSSIKAPYYYTYLNKLEEKQ